MRDFTRLLVWQRSFELAFQLEAALQSRTVRGIPGLRGRTPRAAAAISSNVCEGCGKESVADFLRDLEIAIASAKELFNHMLMANKVGILEKSKYVELEKQREEVVKMLFGFRNAVRRRNGL